MSKERNLCVEDIADIENIIGYTFKQKQLLQQAFTRSSYVNEHSETISNEVLEFYGDRALDIAVTKELSSKLGSVNSDGLYMTKSINGYDTVGEGFLSMIRSEMVRKSNLSERIDKLELDRYLITGRGDAYHTYSMKEDLFESICGAMAIDSNWDFNNINQCILNLLDFDTKFNEVVAPNEKIRYFLEWYNRHYTTDLFLYYWKATYETDDGEIEESPTCTLILVSPESKADPGNLFSNLGYKFRFDGHGETDLEARNNAILEAAESLFGEGNVYELIPNNDLELFKSNWLKPTLDNAVNIVQEMEQGKLIKDVKYSPEIIENDKDGNPIWKCSCSCLFNGIFKENWEISCTRSNQYKSKTDAKKGSALALIEKIFEVFHIILPH